MESLRNLSNPVRYELIGMREDPRLDSLVSTPTCFRANTANINGKLGYKIGAKAQTGQTIRVQGREASIYKCYCSPHNVLTRTSAPSISLSIVPVLASMFSLRGLVVLQLLITLASAGPIFHRQNGSMIYDFSEVCIDYCIRYKRRANTLLAHSILQVGMDTLF